MKKKIRVSMPENQYKKLIRREVQIMRLKNYVKEVWRILKAIETITEEVKRKEKDIKRKEESTLKTK